MPIDRKCRQEEEYSFEMNQMERINEHIESNGKKQWAYRWDTKMVCDIKKTVKQIIPTQSYCLHFWTWLFNTVWKCMYKLCRVEIKEKPCLSHQKFGQQQKCSNQIVWKIWLWDGSITSISISYGTYPLHSWCFGPHYTSAPQQLVPQVRYLQASWEEIIGVIGKYDSNMAPTPPSLIIHGPFAHPAEL